MTVPYGLLIAAAIVGLVGGVVGVATGTDNIVTRIKRSAQTKRDAEMVLHVRFETVAGFYGEPTAQYPVATAKISNNGKVAVKDLRVESSTGYATLDATTLLPDESAIMTFPVVAGRDLPIQRLFDGNEMDAWRPIETPYRVGKVELSFTWRIDGTSERSKPRTFEFDCSGPSLR